MKRLKILLVDDEPETGLALQAWLERGGFEPAYVTGPEAADRAIASESFDVILSDIQMRGNSRLEWIERLLADRHSPPVLLMTGDPQLESAMRAANLPIAGYLLKPLDYTATAAMINHLGSQQNERRAAIAAIDEVSRMLTADAASGASRDVAAQQLKSLADSLAELTQPARAQSPTQPNQRWRDAVVETITVLEKTKHSFRSRELGALRQRLLRLVPAVGSVN